jgi:hypothetical protein
VNLPAAAVTTHVTALDNAIRNDIATLALHSAIADNKAAHNLSNSFIDQFEDGTGIASHSTTYRQSILGEYVSTNNSVTETLGYGDTLAIVYTAGGVATFDTEGHKALMENNAVDVYGIYHQSPSGGSPGYAIMDMTEAVRLTKAEYYAFSTHARPNDVYLDYSTDNSSWTTVTPSAALGGGTISTNRLIPPNTQAWHGFQFSEIEARYWRFKVTAYHDNGNANAGMAEVRFVDSVRGTANAAGNFISTTQTALASVSSMGIVVLYKDNSGTASLNSDIVAAVSADGGSNYSTATLVAGGTFSTGIKIAAVSGVSVTAGTTPKYKISFANQADGSKDTQVHGVALLY